MSATTVSGQCYECGNASVTLFLSRAVPALGILALTAFLFWGGMFASLRRPQRPRFVAWAHHGVGVLQLSLAADRRLLVMIPFLDTVSCFRYAAEKKPPKIKNKYALNAAAGLGYVRQLVWHLVPHTGSSCDKCSQAR
jgi:hypothetical protein